jgi:hypothetical protein
VVRSYFELKHFVICDTHEACFRCLGDRCLAHVVCEAYNIEKEHWGMFKDIVANSIRTRRANSNTGIKKEFMGKQKL